MEKDRVYSLSQIALHNSKKDCWFTINGKVIDMTEFMEDYPGGEEVLIEFAGKDATKAFENIGHSKAAHNLLQKCQVGFLQGYSIIKPVEDIHFIANELEVAKAKDMEAYVIKDEPESKNTALVEFFVPLSVAGFYLGYRFVIADLPLGS